MRSAAAYRGIFVPLVTPFDTALQIDWSALERLVHYYARFDIAGFVPCGSTGEASTLSIEEHKAVISFVTEKAKSYPDLKVIAATGSNNTAECLHLSRHAKAVGADACLIVTPYYNRPNTSGLLEHYRQAGELDIDIILYNIPQRTGRNIPLDELAMLRAHVSRIVGIKEATSDINQLTDVLHHFSDVTDFSVLSGEDNLFFDCMTHGGHGAIMATSLVYPELAVRLYRHLERGELAEAAALNRSLRPLVRTLFSETNPVPIKLALSKMLGIQPLVRLPLGAACQRTIGLIDQLALPSIETA